MSKSQFERTMAQMEIESDDSQIIVERDLEIRSLGSRRSLTMAHTVALAVLCLSVASLLTIGVHRSKAGAGHPDHEPSVVEVGSDFSEVVGIRKLSNITFKDIDGTPKNPVEIFRDHGYTWGRMRVMVDPDGMETGGLVQDIEYAVETALLLKKYGLKILLVFHYSHKWSNTQQQMVPHTWGNGNNEPLQVEELSNHVYQHTLKSMKELRATGIIPDAIQIGNEVNAGILWEMGRLPSNERNFVEFTRAATRAIRDAVEESDLFPKIVLHIHAGDGKNFTEQWFQNFTDAGGDFDIIGLSYLPVLHGSVDDFKETLANIKQKFPDKLLWIVETAYNWKETVAPADGCPYPQTPEGQYQFLNQLRSILQNYGDCAVFYWGSHYTQSQKWLMNSTQNWEEVEGRALFDEEGTALKGIDGFFGN